MKTIPDNFLWGGASAAHQYEGGVHEGGKSYAICDLLTSGAHKKPRRLGWKNLETGEFGFAPIMFGLDTVIPEGAVPSIIEGEYYPSHKATDFYHRYKEDIALMAEMGFKTFRMSMSWTRIFPDIESDQPSKEGLAFYDAVFDELHKYGIEPLVTLVHADTPLQVVTKYGGWINRKVIDLYVKYTKTVFEHYKDKVKYWLTFNEINMMEFTQAAAVGVFKPTLQTKAQAAHNQFLANALSVKEAKNISKDIKIGVMLGYQPFYGLTCDPEDQLLATLKERDMLFYSDVMMTGIYPTYKWIEYEDNNIHLETEKEDFDILRENTCDFLSFSCYGSSSFTTHEDEISAHGNLALGVKNPYLKATDWGWATDPHCLRIALNRLYARYHKPLWIAENGIGWADELTETKEVHDDYRIQYLQQNLSSMKDAIIKDGIEVIGYTMWAAIDLVSAGTGEMKKRYGFVYVDMDDKGNGTLERYKKDSFYWYKDVIASNGRNLG